MRIVAPWYSPVLPNGVVDEKCAVENALDFSGCNSRTGTGSLHPSIMQRLGAERVLVLLDDLALVQKGTHFRLVPMSEIS